MTEWRKSTYSPNGTDCVEVGIRDDNTPASHLGDRNVCLVRVPRRHEG